MSAAVQIDVDMRGLQAAMRKYMDLKKKSGPEVVNKAMRFWLPFASSKVKKIVKSPAQITSILTAPPNSKRGSRKLLKAFRAIGAIQGTRAAAIVAARMLKKGGIPANAELQSKINQFMAARSRSAKYLSAGFIPAFRKFRVPPRGTKVDQSAGHSAGNPSLPSQGEYAHAHAVNAREATMIMAPTAFESSIPQVKAQFLKWLAEDVNKNAKRSGFK